MIKSGSGPSLPEDLKNFQPMELVRDVDPLWIDKELCRESGPFLSGMPTNVNGSQSIENFTCFPDLNSGTNGESENTSGSIENLTVMVPIVQTTAAVQVQHPEPAAGFGEQVEHESTTTSAQTLGSSVTASRKRKAKHSSYWDPLVRPSPRANAKTSTVLPLLQANRHLTVADVLTEKGQQRNFQLSLADKLVNDMLYDIPQASHDKRKFIWEYLGEEYARLILPDVYAAVKERYPELVQ